MSQFEALVKERRSANRFIQGIELPERDLEEIFNLVKFSPSAFNLQHTHYIVVKDPAQIERIYEATGKQHKIRTASAVIAVLGHMDADRDAVKINEGLFHLGVMDKLEFEGTVQFIQQFYRQRGEAFRRDEAIRNASLSAMQLMLIAKDKGWDTCPMIGFDPSAITEVLQIPDRYVPAMLIAIGKEDKSVQRPRGYRKPVGEFVSYDSF